MTASTDVKEPQATVSPTHSEDTIVVNNNVNVNSVHNAAVEVVNHVDDTNCQFLKKAYLWNDYVTFTELRLHDEELPKSQQRNHLDVPILEYEKLAQLVGTDDYLSIRIGDSSIL